MIELIGKDREGYEVRKLPYGKVCTWYPDYFVLECECGGLLLCADSTALCQCGADHTALAQDLLDSQTDTGSYTWFGDCSPFSEGGPFSFG